MAARASRLGQAATEIWVDGVFVFRGDSLTYAHGANGIATGGAYHELAVAELESRFGGLTLGTSYNEGTDGQETGHMLNDASTRIDAHFAAGARLKKGSIGNIPHIYGGVNDLFNGIARGTALQNIEDNTRGRLDFGWPVVILGTLTPLGEVGTPGDYETNRLWLNDAIQTFAAGFPRQVYVADYGSTAQAQDPMDPDWYQNDHGHWGPALHIVQGIEVLVPVLVRAMNRAA